MKALREQIIQDIILEIEKGHGFATSCANICKRYEFAQRTFAKYWKDANTQYLASLERRKEIKETVATSEYLSSLTDAIMTKNEKLRILETIILGKASFAKTYVAGGELKTTPAEPDVEQRLKAIDIHNKMSGHIAATEGRFSAVVAATDIDTAKAGKNLDRWSASQLAFLASLHNPEESAPDTNE